jgi:hypothetical protein
LDNQIFQEAPSFLEDCPTINWFLHWDPDADTPAGVPTRAPDTGSGDSSAGAKLRQGHDQREQALPVDFDDA